MTEIEWNTVKYIDCMDEDEGLPSLSDNSIDLCLTDPIHNINFKGYHDSKTHYTLSKRTLFNDKITNYREWCVSWFTEVKRICNRIIFTCGLKNLKIWYSIDDFDLAIWYSPEKQGSSLNSRLNKFEPILTYNIRSPNRLKNNHFKFFKDGKHGFFNRKGFEIIHPTAKPVDLYYYLISSVKAYSVIDPFLGSGTTAEVCKELDIPWLGYEIEKDYKKDIDMRLDNIINKNENSLRYYLKK